MSNIVLFCCKKTRELLSLDHIFQNINSQISPDQFEPHPPDCMVSKGVQAGILNPIEGNYRSPGGIGVGYFADSAQDWNQVGATPPEGSYALMRWNEAQVELVTDTVGSRTIWYFQTDECFAASTSQRALIALLGDFQINPTAILWMLSSGSLGPGQSWDMRLAQVTPDTCLVLDRQTWQIRTRQNAIRFEALNCSEGEHYQHLEQALHAVFAGFHPDPSRWLGLLSGGVDSRAIVLELAQKNQYQFITWGLQAAQNQSESDAGVADQLAKYFGLNHEYFSTDLAEPEAVEKIFLRFFQASEGRVDHIAGYMDGLSIWKHISDKGFSGVIRGDEGFGWHVVANDFDARYSVGAILFSDYHNLGSPSQAGMVGWAEQRLPEELERRSDETLAQYRDRIYQQFRIPTVLAALNGIKCAYVEVANPLLFRTLILAARQLPDPLRTEKALWKRLVDHLSPPVPYASQAAISNPKQILKSAPVSALLLDGVDTQMARNIFSPGLVQRLHFRLSAQPSSSTGGFSAQSLRSRLVDRMSPDVKRLFKRAGARPDLDEHQLAFRAYLILKMIDLLTEDAKQSGMLKAFGHA
jgi:hypothetical protein